MNFKSKRHRNKVIIQPPENNTIPESLEPSGTLIIGDSILKVLHKKTFENAKIHAIIGARMLDIFRELNCKSDLKNFEKIIIHAGTIDIDNGTPTNEIVESMEAILTLLLVEAPMADVFLSAICLHVDKSFDTEIRHLNESLRDLTNRFDIHFIDAGQNMTYRNGTIDASQLSDSLHLSKLGKETLIRTYSDSVKSLKLSSRTGVILQGMTLDNQAKTLTTMVKKDQSLNRYATVNHIHITIKDPYRADFTIINAEMGLSHNVAKILHMIQDEVRIITNFNTIATRTVTRVVTTADLRITTRTLENKIQRLFTSWS